jgi:hypothetical protein
MMAIGKILILVICLCEFSLADTQTVKFMAVKTDTVFVLSDEGHPLMSSDGCKTWGLRNSLKDVQALNVSGSDLYIVQSVENFTPSAAKRHCHSAGR